MSPENKDDDWGELEYEYDNKEELNDINRKNDGTAMSDDSDDWGEADEKFRRLLCDMMEEESFFDDRPGRTDYWFLDEEPEAERLEHAAADERNHVSLLLKRKRHERKKRLRFSGTLSRAVALVLIVFAVSSGVAVWINSEPANALKFHLEKKFYETKDGGFSTEPEEEGTEDENCITRKYKSMDDIDKAKKFMPNLPVPEYIPDGFKLEELIIEKSSNEMMVAQYIFAKNQDRIFINILNGVSETKYDISSKGELVLLEDRELCVWEDIETDSYGCNFLSELVSIHILGNTTKDQMIEIASGINLK